MNPNRPLSGLLIVTMFATVVAAQEASSSPVLSSTPIPAPPALPAERAVSIHVAELLAASMPRYKPIPEKSEPVAPANQESGRPPNETVRLPRFVVSEPKEAKLPAPLEILAKRELEHYAMDHYIGPEDGLDRGVLNLFTIAGVWKKIPVLGAFPFLTSETNQDRAMRLYDTAERKRKMDEMIELMNLTKVRTRKN